MKPIGKFQSVLAFLTEGQTLPVTKLISDLVVGMATSQTTILSRTAAALDEDGDLPATLNRLSAGLASPQFDLAVAQHRLPLRYNRHFRRAGGKGVRVAVDYTDIGHPYANKRRGRGMEGVDDCWDGSIHRVGVGHPCVAIEILVPTSERDGIPRGLRLPAMLRPFNRGAADFVNDKQPFFDGVAELAPHIGVDAIWLFDRGFDDRVYFAVWDKANIRWCIRMKVKPRKDSGDSDSGNWGEEDDDGKLDDRPGGRIVILTSGVETTLRQAAHAAPVVGESTRLSTRARRKGRKIPNAVKYRAVLCRVPDPRDPIADQRIRTLICVRESTGAEIVLLADRALHDIEEIREYADAYTSRWRVEESTRAAKQRGGWGLAIEDTRVLQWQSTERMLFLVCALMCFYSELSNLNDKTLAPLLALAPTCADDPDDLRYRLCRGFSEYLRRRIRDERTKRARSHVQPDPRRRAWHSLFGAAA